MSQGSNTGIGPRLGPYFIGLAGLGFAIYLVMRSSTAGPMAALSPLVGLMLILWFFMGRNAWWLPVPLAVSLGGVVWIGFKVNTYEIAMLLALLALIPIWAFKMKSRTEGQAPLPKSVVILLVYLCAHCLTGLYMAKTIEGSGLGTVMRCYVAALWGILFVVLYYIYGNSRHVRAMLVLVYVGLLLRILFAVWQMLFPGFVYLNIFGGFFLLSPGASLEMRETALRMLIMSLAFFFASRNRFWRFVLVLAMLCSMLLLVMGAGRISAIMGLFVILGGMAIQKRFIPLAGGVLVLGLAILVLNARPEIIDNAPDYAKRVLSALVFTERLDIHEELQGSNEWHFLLMRLGMLRWTASIDSVLLGSRIHPYDLDFESVSTDLYSRAIIASDTAHYESALWSTLVSFGVLGVVLYFLVFRALFKGPLGELLKTGCRDMRSAVYFIAFIHLVLYVGFAWIAGGFPSYELVLAVIAKGLYEDRQIELRNRPDELPDKPPIGRLIPALAGTAKRLPRPPLPPPPKVLP